jgi:hypothetical protein
MPARWSSRFPRRSASTNLNCRTLRRIAASNLIADAVGIGLPRILGDDSLQLTTTDAAGRFVMHNVAVVGAVAAQLADRRSLPAMIADHVRLVLEPTRSVSGKVDLQGTPFSENYITYKPALRTPVMFGLIAPIAPDGSFVPSGVSRGAGRIGVVMRIGGSDRHAEYQPVPASPRSISDVQLTAAKSTRTVDVVIRSTAATRIDAPNRTANLTSNQPVGCPATRHKLRAVRRDGRTRGRGP